LCEISQAVAETRSPLEGRFENEQQWDRFRSLPAVCAALDSVPDEVAWWQADDFWQYALAAQHHNDRYERRSAGQTVRTQGSQRLSARSPPTG